MTTLEQVSKLALAYREALAQMIEGWKGFDPKTNKRTPYTNCYRDADKYAQRILRQQGVTK